MSDYRNSKRLLLTNLSPFCVFATFVETGHRIVEMGGVAIAVFPCRQNVLKLSLGVGNRSKYALAAYIFAELHGAR